ncbi:MAG: TlpA disulfide reductase family protein [Desulfobacteraceae bacterium]|jgi:peroxiredoxin
MGEKQIQPKGRHRSILLVGLILTALGLYFYIQWQKPSNITPGPELAVAGNPAPNFELPLLNGEVVQLNDYRGKVVFLNIWATWCGPCREEMPSMEKLYQQLKGQAFEILAVSVDSQGDGAVAPFVKQHNLTFPVLLDREGRTGSLYSTTGVPETFIIDKDGIIISKIVGYRNWSAPKVVEALKVLAQRPTGNN